LPNRAHGLRAIALASIVAFAGTTAIVAPVAATDPAPVESPAPSPSPTPDPSAAPSASVDPSPSVAPSASAAPTATPAPAARASVVRPNLALRVVRIALAQRGDQYRAGGQGPYYFDCSGLVRYSYRKAGVSARLGGGSSARGMLYWGRLHGLTSQRNPRLGDVVIYGGGTHAAIWIGSGRVVHALNPRLDIRVTSLHAVTKPFTTFIHTHLPSGG
jgi:cell wall-associated NlpC family hydrolase